MNKEFIPYEQALELKELGFDELSLDAYYKTTDGGVSLVRFPDEERQINYPFERIPAPLYQQAFRWFREKYGLYSAVNVDQTMDPKFAYCISKYWTDALSWGWDTIVFNSDLYYDYEEAELDCLKKLIEIVKQKS
jgi:hypothetical protein